MLNISFRNDIFRYDPLTMGEKVFKTVKKEYINTPIWSIPKM